jgi:Ca2+-binding RTX toxin-like protein
MVDLSVATAQNTIGAGIDTLTHIDFLRGSNFNDVLSGDVFNNQIEGLSGDDILNGGDGDDGLIGGAGNDTLDGGNGADQLDGGTGFDFVTYANSPAGVIVNLSDGLTPESGGFAQGDILTFQSGGSVVQTVEGIIGSAFDDTLIAGDVGMELRGGDGSDTITGSAATDVLSGDAGDDTLSGNGGNDGIGGGDGDDNLSGSGGNDVITGDAGNDIITGDAGADTLQGNAGDDNLSGGDDNDSLRGGAGSDTLDGGAGTDSASYSDSAAAVTVNLETGLGTGGDAAGDVLALDPLLGHSTIENLFGSSFNDILAGDAGANQINGNAGNDIITGGGGRDILLGGTGTGPSSDNDTFVYNSLSELVPETSGTTNVDQIFGFTIGSSVAGGRDIIDLRGVFAHLGLDFGGSSSVAAGQGYWGIASAGAAGILVFVDPDGGGAAGTDDYWVALLVGATGINSANVLV